MKKQRQRFAGVMMCLEGVRLVEQEGYTVRAAAKKTGYSPMSISRSRKRLGLEPLETGRQPGKIESPNVKTGDKNA